MGNADWRMGGGVAMPKKSAPKKTTQKRLELKTEKSNRGDRPRRFTAGPAQQNQGPKLFSGTRGRACLSCFPPEGIGPKFRCAMQKNKRAEAEGCRIAEARKNFE